MNDILGKFISRLYSLIQLYLVVLYKLWLTEWKLFLQRKFMFVLKIMLSKWYIMVKSQLNIYFSFFINISQVIEDALILCKNECKRFYYFARKEIFIEPEENVFYQCLHNMMIGGVSVLRPGNCTEQFIPLRSVLKTFFSLENIN